MDFMPKWSFPVMIAYHILFLVLPEIIHAATGSDASVFLYMPLAPVPFAISAYLVERFYKKSTRK